MPPPILSQFSARRMAGQMGILTIANVVARLISAISFILIARLLGPELYGPIAATLALTRLLSVFFNLGLDAWLLREAGGGQDTTMGRKGGTVWGIKAVAGGIWLVALVVLAPWLNQDSFPLSLLLWVALGVWLEDLVLTAGFVFQAALRAAAAAVNLIVLQLLLLVATLSLLAMGVLDPVILMQGRAVLAGLALIWSFWWLGRAFPLQWVLADVWPTLHGTRVFGLSLGLAMVGRQADVAIVANWLGSEAAGLYAPAVMLSSTVLLLAMSIHNVLLPTLSQMYRQTPEALPRLVNRLLWGAGGVGGVLFLLLWFTAAWLVTWLYGPAYVTTGYLLQILGLMIWVRCWIAVQTAVLAAVGWQRYRVKVQFVGMLVAVLLNLYVVTQTNWGLVGVAWVYVAGEFLLCLGYAWYLWQWRRVGNGNGGANV